MSCTAVKEMERLHHAYAWSPLSKVAEAKRNQFCTRYVFEDDSVLTVYVNGDASWFFRDARGYTDGEQRWHNWHHCNVVGFVGAA